MQEKPKYISIDYGSTVLNRRIVLFFIGVMAPLLLLMMQSCYSSTAVKGTPVKDLAKVRDQKIAKARSTQKDKEAIAKMTAVKRNKVFKEITNLPEYIIGPLDVLEITSHVGEKRSIETITVNNRGKISYSFIDDLDVAGRTPSEVDNLVTKRLSNYLKNPRIDVIVKEFKSKSALLLGEFSFLRAGAGTQTRSESGRMFLKGKTTLMDLIAQAGGYTEDADIKVTRLIRGGRTYIINLFDLIEKGDETLNVIIDDGDIVDMSELPEFGERVYVLGEVTNQGVYSLRDAQDLLGAIALAGSITRLATEENTLIVREYEPGKKPLVMMADLRAILRQGDLSQNIPLEDGDLVYVPRMLIGDINDWIANTTPLLDFLFYPKRLQDSYSTRDYLHINRR